jgi:acyl carrier protein
MESRGDLPINGQNTEAEPQLLSTLLDIIRDVKRLPPDSEVPKDLVGVRFLSSMQAVQLVVRLEQRFSIRFDPADFSSLSDIHKLATLVEERQSR